MKLVILDSCVFAEGDMDWSAAAALVPRAELYPHTRPEQAAQRIGDAELVILDRCPVNEALLQQCPALRWVGITATGVDRIDLNACRRRGVTVANVPGYAAYSVAQLTFSLLLAICQCAARQDRAVRAGYWRTGAPAEFGLLPQVELYGKTLGIIGYGAIGQVVARMGAAFGLRVLVNTRTVPSEQGAHPVEFVPLARVLGESDVLSLHCPATPETRGMIGEAALRQMKPGCILLNTARGALVDEAAVAAACTSGRLGFYAADAFAVEPLPMDSPLRNAPHVLLSPHIGWATGGALARLAGIVTQNLRSYLEGHPENVVT